MKKRRKVVYDVTHFQDDRGNVSLWYSSELKRWAPTTELTGYSHSTYSHHFTRRSADRSLNKLADEYDKHNLSGEIILIKLFRRGGRLQVGEYFIRIDNGNNA